tara:strand:+ start:50 stop:676 length:627 start_codon:yes stop_codon:yes gene_type:complete
MNIFIFVQARMNSSRLPGKVMFKIDNKTILQHVILRLKKISHKKTIVVLCSNSKKDDRIVNHCKKNKIKYFRGSLNNVYKRFYDAVNFYKCQNFIRITADSPLIDKNIVEKCIKILDTNKYYDIVTNCMEKTFPKGQSVEIINSKVFTQNYKNIKNNKHKEHIFQFFYRNKRKFKIFNVKSRKKFSYKSLALDTIKDFYFIKKIILSK